MTGPPHSLILPADGNMKDTIADLLEMSHSIELVITHCGECGGKEADNGDGSTEDRDVPPPSPLPLAHCSDTWLSHSPGAMATGPILLAAKASFLSVERAVQQRKPR